MWDPTVSQLIDELERLRDKHGDVRVTAYSDPHNAEFRDIEPQMSEKTGGEIVVLLILETEDA